MTRSPPPISKTSLRVGSPGEDGEQVGEDIVDRNRLGGCDLETVGLSAPETTYRDRLLDSYPAGLVDEVRRLVLQSVKNEGFLSPPSATNALDNTRPRPL